MKNKKNRIIIISAVILLIIGLFLPIPKGSCDDGGTREYVALTYKIVDWNRLTADGVYEKTRVYWGEDRYKSLDTLWYTESQYVNHEFRATVVEINGKNITVEPVEGESELLSSDRIIFHSGNLPEIDVKVGSVVEIKYKGNIKEIYPAQILAFDWKLSKNLSHLEYNDVWLDKNTAEKYDNNIFSDIVITEIYSNCFFATTVIPMPYQIKLNGKLSDEWCVGDQIICKYENTYYDQENNRVEADLISVSVSDFKPDPFVCYKPVIYLYPKEECEVDVSLELDGEFTCTYPEYNNGWNVIANPDGTLTDKNGKEYNYLYWESEMNTEYEIENGFCVKGEDTAKFLEFMLEKLGLNRREANEFIVYWLPLMQNNKYNIISFDTKQYEESAKLNVTPSPDTIIRVFMTYKASDVFVELQGQEFTTPKRCGFTVVEWGGTQIK